MMKRCASYTMRDVARLARVSVMTVSTIVNGRGGVSPELTRRVEDAIATLDYHPNEVARSLKANRTSTIGLVVPDVSNFFFNDVLRGVETKAREKGFSVVLGDSHEDPGQERELLSMFARRRVDGILLASTQSNLGERRSARRSPPIVCFDRDPAGFKFGAVVVDNVAAAFESARHLIELGHQRIAVIAGPEDTLTGRARLEGVRKALQEAHIPWREEYVRPGGFSTLGGYHAALALLRFPTPPTAIIACDNRMTFGLLNAVKELGLQCPRDVSLLGFDEFDWYDLISPRLTTIAQPSYEMGRQATEMLMKAITGEDQLRESDGGKCVVLKAHLRLRESTAPPTRVVSRAARGASPAIGRAARSSKSRLATAATEKAVA